MPTDNDLNIERIADALEDIALAFLGPQGAFTDVNGKQLKGVVEKAQGGIWGLVQAQLALIPGTSVANVLAVSVTNTRVNLAGVRGGIAFGGFDFGLIDEVVAETRARNDAKREISRLRGLVNAEFLHTGVLLGRHLENFSPDLALETYQDFVRRTEAATNQIEAGLLGVKSILTRGKIVVETDNDFKPLPEALILLDETRVEAALEPDPALAGQDEINAPRAALPVKTLADKPKRAR